MIFPNIDEVSLYVFGLVRTTLNTYSTFIYYKLMHENTANLKIKQIHAQNTKHKITNKLE